MTKIKLPQISENEELEKEFTYPNDLEFDINRPLVISVKKPYVYWNRHIMTEGLKQQIIDEENGEKKKDEEYLPKEVRYYNPFEEFTTEKFLNTVMSVKINDMDSILGFYNNYGPLLYTGYGDLEGDEKNSAARMFGILDQTAMERLKLFVQEMTILQSLIQLYDAVQTNNIEYLRDSNFLQTLNNLDPNGSDEYMIKEAKNRIMIFINRKSNLINPVVGMPNGEFTKFITSSCLLGVFYIRLYELITENQKTNKCRLCGDYFIPRKADANFCPPPEANERSKCANRYDAMVRRSREWHFKDGLTIEEIQEKINKPKRRSKTEIQNWMDTYKGKMKK
jgi:hypothetical protein